MGKDVRKDIDENTGRPVRLRVRPRSVPGTGFSPRAVIYDPPCRRPVSPEPLRTLDKLLSFGTSPQALSTNDTRPGTRSQVPPHHTPVLHPYPHRFVSPLPLRKTVLPGCYMVGTPRLPTVSLPSLVVHSSILSRVNDFRGSRSILLLGTRVFGLFPLVTSPNSSPFLYTFRPWFRE